MSTVIAVVSLELPAAASTASWSSVVTPNPSGSDSFLYSVSCVGPSFCVAVGATSTGSATDTLIESWNGSSWSTMSSPDDSSTMNYLEGVSCKSTTFCVAVGFENYPTPEPDPLIDTWNGSSWSASSAAVPTSNKSYLDAVSCTSSTSCEAVGYYSTNSETYTLVETLTGSSWSPPITVNPSSSYNYLGAVSCMSASHCIAVGNYTNGSTEDALEESWNGSTWSTQQAASPSSTYNALQGISCTSTTACTAVGVSYNSSVAESLVESWNGSSWSTVSSADPSGTYNYLGGVYCTSSTACTAVGVSYNASSTPQTLVETPSGTSPTPAITSFSPGSGPVGTKVTITGTNLNGATQVTFDGMSATISKDAAGKIQVTTSTGTAKSASNFTVT
ncbi:MAG: hypothetical protein WAM97_05490 [Acidimicrobiales bacterium]